MRVLLVLTVGMGVLIVVGVVTLGVLIVQRTAGVPATPGHLMLDQPAGTRVVNTSLGVDRLAVQLTGGGPDRVVVVDLKTGRIATTIGLPP